MSVIGTLFDDIRKAIVMEEKLERLAKVTERLEAIALDHESRITRLETYREIEQSGGDLPRLTKD